MARSKIYEVHSISLSEKIEARQKVDEVVQPISTWSKTNDLDNKLFDTLIEQLQWAGH